MSKKTTISIIIALLALALIAGVVLGCKRKQEKATVTEKPTTTTQEPSSQPATQPATPKLVAQPKLDSAGIWGKKPVLNYLFSSRATLKKLKEGLGLTEEHIEKIANVVRDETENIRSLYQQPQTIVKDRSLSSEEQKKEIEKMKYNERVADNECGCSSWSNVEIPPLPVYPQPGAQNVFKDSNGTVEIRIGEDITFGGFEFNMKFKHGIIDILTVEHGIPAQQGRNVIENGPKETIDGDYTTLFYGAASYGDPPPPSGALLATITFEGVGIGITDLDLFDVKVGNADAEQIPVDVTDGSVTVIEPLGDVSGDGEITAYDASLILQHVVSLRELSAIEQERADVTGDGTISALDAALILQYTVGLITSFPVDSAPVAPALNPKNETQVLVEAIKQFESISLTKEQKKVLEELKGLISKQLLPKHTALLQNYPNPFNPETWIPYQLADAADVTVEIYSVTGDLIKSINLGRKVAGSYMTKKKAVRWDGRNELGEKVASGVYFVSLRAGKFRAIRRMVLVK